MKHYWNWLDDFYTSLVLRLGILIGLTFPLIYFLDAVANTDFLKFGFLISFAVLLMIVRLINKRDLKDWFFYLVISFMVASYVTYLVFSQNFEFIFWEDLNNSLSTYIGAIILAFFIGIILQLVFYFLKSKKFKINHNTQKLLTLVLTIIIFLYISNNNLADPRFTSYLISVGQLAVLPLPLFALKILFKK